MTTERRQDSDHDHGRRRQSREPVFCCIYAAPLTFDIHQLRHLRNEERGVPWRGSSSAPPRTRRGSPTSPQMLRARRYGQVVKAIPHGHAQYAEGGTDEPDDSG